MANIMITERCNLRCPYCFANEFVNENGKKQDMTMEDFNTALEFILTDKDERVGIIGGEPTIHPQFKEILETIIHDDRIKIVTVFTNGINLDKYVKQLVNPKFDFLINCNSPDDIGERQYDKLVKSLDLLINEYYMKPKISLGINIYKPGLSYDYLVELLKRYGLKTCRTAICVPNTNVLRKINPLEYFKEMKPTVMSFFRELYKHGIMPNYDCNLLPSCILDDEEKEMLDKFFEFEKDAKRPCNLRVDSKCAPVIDILPSLEAVRCFGLSEEHKVKIGDFAGIRELWSYFNNYFDAFAYNTVSTPECINCNKRETTKCSGGCFSFKVDKINEVRAYSKKLMGIS